MAKTAGQVSYNVHGDVFTRMYGGLARLSLARTKNIFTKQYNYSNIATIYLSRLIIWHGL